MKKDRTVLTRWQVVGSVVVVSGAVVASMLAVFLLSSDLRGAVVLSSFALGGFLLSRALLNTSKPAALARVIAARVGQRLARAGSKEVPRGKRVTAGGLANVVVPIVAVLAVVAITLHSYIEATLRVVFQRILETLSSIGE